MTVFTILPITYSPPQCSSRSLILDKYINVPPPIPLQILVVLTGNKNAKNSLQSKYFYVNSPSCHWSSVNYFKIVFQCKYWALLTLKMNLQTKFVELALPDTTFLSEEQWCELPRRWLALFKDNIFCDSLTHKTPLPIRIW